MSCLSSHKNPINRLHLRQFLGSKTTKANKLLKTDANEARQGTCKNDDAML